MADAQKQSSETSRRTFLKIGSGIVVGAVVAGAGVAAYESSVIGSNNSSSSSTVSSLSSELSDTQNALSSAQSTISTLSSQLGTTQTALGNAQSSLSAANAQNATLNSQLTTTQQSLSSANSQISNLQTDINTMTGFLALTNDQQALVAALANTIIPTDSNGPGATQAGVVYFIDRQLATDYGNTGEMYMSGPFVAANQSASITVNGTTFSGGTPTMALNSHYYYQHPLSLREFWNLGLQYIEAYANSAYGGNYEDLSATDQSQVLVDMWNNKPTNFEGMTPQEFYAEVQSLVWAGFFTDPLYGGNKGMVGWQLIGFPGLNQGDFYGEGYTLKQLMVASSPTLLKPASIAQIQQSEAAD